MSTTKDDDVVDELPTLRSIEDTKNGVDLEKVFNLAALYDLTLERDHSEHHARMGVWHPSACGMCKRAQVLQFTRVPPTNKTSPKLQGIFDMGHVLHDMVQGKLAQLGPALAQQGVRYEFQREVGYDPENDQLFQELKIGGTTDGVLRLWNDYFEQRGIVEIKSQNDDRHKKLLELPTAWPSHLLQAHIYAYRFDAPIIWVFYLNKNNAEREVKLHVFEWEIFDRAIVYFTECADYVDRGELPPREESWFECRECPYRAMCKPTILKHANLPKLSTLTLKRRP